MNNTLRLAAVGLCLAAGACPHAAFAQRAAIDVARSSLTVHVFKAGFFSAFGHDHQIRAPIKAGWIDHGPASPGIEFVVSTQAMTVLDPDLSSQKRAEVQETMQGPKVLDSAHFPEIRFRSISVRAAGRGRWLVEGELTLHGATQSLTVTAEQKDGRYLGVTGLRQRPFGMVPISVAGGTIKVKDEMRLEFDVAVTGE